MESVTEMRNKVVAKAQGDADFRQKLVEDPRAAAGEALGFDIPDSVKVHVHEDSASEAHIILPPSKDLTVEELDQVFGGGYLSGNDKCIW